MERLTTKWNYQFLRLILFILIVLVWTGTMLCNDAGDISEFGSSRSEPINSGFFFHEGKYIDTPYIIERRGLSIYLNDILLIPGSTLPLYDTTVENDPGNPPSGSSPFNKTPEGVDSRDTYWPKKWRYLKSHFDLNTAKDMMLETYKKSEDVSDVQWKDWSKKEVLIITNKNGTQEKRIDYTLSIGESSNKKITKENLIQMMENEREFQERRFKNNAILFKKGGMEIITGGALGLNSLDILLSDANDSEKINSLENGGLLRHGVKTSYWIVTDFKSSPQLKVRIDDLKNKNSLKPIIDETKSYLNSRISDPILAQKSNILLENKTIVIPQEQTLIPINNPQNPEDVNIVKENNIETMIGKVSSFKKKAILSMFIIILVIISLLAKYLNLKRRINHKGGSI